MSGSVQANVKVPSGPAPSFAPVQSGLLQRKSLLDRAFADYRGKRLVSQFPLVQTKLTINQPNDQYEQEADRVADQVMRVPETRASYDELMSSLQTGTKAECNDKLIPAKQTPSSRRTLPASSQTAISSVTDRTPLPKSERAYFEPRFGWSFENVRIHNGVDADTAARLINARAFTIGNDIVFAQGQYRPGILDGRHLLAHELTHTVQQMQLGYPVVQREEGHPSPGPIRVAAPARAQAANALDHAIERLSEAINHTERGDPIPQDVQHTLERFFPEESAEFLPLLLRRIVGVRSIIETIRIQSVFRPLDESVDPEARDINSILQNGDPITPWPLIDRSGGRSEDVSPTYILVFPRFYRERHLQATRLIHECFHIYYPFIEHSEEARGHENPRANAFSYQGFVSMLGGLSQVRPLELFPRPE